MSKSTKSIAVQVIEEKIKQAQESFSFWVTESNGDVDSFAGKLAQENLQTEVTFKLLLKDIIEAEAREA